MSKNIGRQLRQVVVDAESLGVHRDSHDTMLAAADEIDRLKAALAVAEGERDKLMDWYVAAMEAQDRGAVRKAAGLGEGESGK